MGYAFNISFSSTAVRDIDEQARWNLFPYDD